MSFLNGFHPKSNSLAIILSKPGATDRTSAVIAALHHGTVHLE
jgi:hypothetical protein